MKKFAFILISAFAFGQNGNVGINTENPTATLDINGNVRIRTLQNGSVNDSILVVNDGFVKKTKLSITENHQHSFATVTQSEYVKLQGTETYGRLLHNNCATISSSSSLIKTTTTGSSDWDLASRLSAGKYTVTFTAKLMSFNLNKTPYFILRTLSSNGAVYDSQLFVMPDTLDVGIDLPLNFYVDCPTDCNIQVYKVQSLLVNNLGIKLTGIKQ